MNRIIYREITGINGLYRSSSTFSHPTNGAVYRIELYMNDDTFKIVDERAGGAVVTTGTAVGGHRLKIAAKQALIGLGVDGFTKEVRGPRGPYKKATNESDAIQDSDTTPQAS